MTGDYRDEYYLPYETPVIDREAGPERLHRFAGGLWQTHRLKDCEKCPLHLGARTVCMFGNGPAAGGLAVVADQPSVQDDALGPFSLATDQWAYMARVMSGCDVELRDVYRTYAVRCHVPKTEDREKQLLIGVKQCLPYLWREMWEVRPAAILTLGATSFYAFTKQKGVTARRGQAFLFTLPCACDADGLCCRGAGVLKYTETHDKEGREHDEPVTVHTKCLCAGVCHAADEPFSTWVVPTLSPQAVLSRPSLNEDFESDVAKWQRLGRGIDVTPAVEIIEVRTREGLDEMAAELNLEPRKLLTFDLETRGFQDQRAHYSKVWCAALSNGTVGEHGIRVFSVPLEHPEAPWFGGGPLAATDTHYPAAAYAVEVVTGLVLDPERRVSGHNVKFDVRHATMLARRYGLLRGWRIGYDTILAAHTLDETRGLSLLNQCSVALGVNNWGKGVQHFGLAEVEDLRELLAIDNKNGLTELWGEDGMSYYCGRDVAYTHALFEQQVVKLDETNEQAKRLLQRLILPGVNAFVQLELNGLWVDQARLALNDAILAEKGQALHAQLIRDHVSQELVDFWQARTLKNTKKGETPRDFLANDNFVVDWLYSPAPRGLGLPVYNVTKTKKPQVNEETLKLYPKVPALKVLTELKKAGKGRAFFASWLEWMGDDGRLHANFNLSGTVTGRRSNSNPNLQQVPRDEFIRTVLGAPPGWLFLEVDYSQLEVRLAAWLASEPTMLEIFQAGGDIYRSTAARFLGKAEADVTYEERRKAKAYVLGFLYGMGPGGFVRYAKETYDIEVTLEEARASRDLFFEMYPGLVRWHEKARRTANDDMEIMSPDGRVRHLINILSSDHFEKGKAERQAINSPVQGLGADFTLAAIVELLKTLDPGEARIVGDIHDAVLFEVREDVWERNTRRILQVMEAPPIMTQLVKEWPVRLMAEAQVGRHWKEGPEFTIDDLDDPVKGPVKRALVAEGIAA